MSSQALPAPAKQLFRYLFEQATLGIAVEDFEGKLLLANPALCSMLGYPANELCGMNCSQFSNPEDSKDDWALFQQLRDGIIDQYSLEKRYTRKDGTQLWGSLKVSLLKDGDGGAPLVFAFLEEITERKFAEQELARTNDRLRSAMESGKSVGWEWDVRTGRDSWFGNLQIMFGIPSDTFVGRAEDFHRYVHPEDRELVAKAVADARQNREPYAAEFRVVWRDGTVRWVAADGKFYYAGNGDAERMLGMAVDITERKQAEEALRESEARERRRAKELETILDAVPVPVRITRDSSCRHMTGNRAAYEQARVPVGRNMSSSGLPAEGPQYRLMEDGKLVSADTLPMQQAAATGKPVYRRELTVVYEDGSQRETVENAVPLLDEAGKPWGAVGTSIDLTEQKLAQHALRESEDKLRLLLNSTAEAIYGVDLEHRCTFCNAAFLRTTGYERVDQVLGKNVHELIHHSRADGTPFPEDECQVHRVIRTGEGVHVDDEVFWRANKTSFPAEYWSYPQRRGQEIVGAVTAFIDITERKLSDAALASVSRRLIEAQEQERTRIARELHDDIGQRLAMLIIDLGQIQEDSPNLPVEVRSRMNEVWSQASDIAIDIQTLSHELHSAKLEYLGITAAIGGFCKEFGEQQNVEIEFLAHDLPNTLPADTSLGLFRVLQEALHNSAKHSGVRRFEVRLWGTDDAVNLTISDSGNGFIREAVKQGPGLGLLSMEERLKLLNGTISIESRPQRGTTIHARVPVGPTSNFLRATG